MRGLTSSRPSHTLAYLALAALALQIALSITAPGLAAWSPAHAHITLDGRDHPHTHAWERPALGLQTRIPGHEADNHSQSEPAPSSDVGGAGAAIALPVAEVLLALAGMTLLTRLLTAPQLFGVAFAPVTPPPRG